MSLESLLNYIIPILAIAIGYALKRRPAFTAKFIPVVSFAVAAVVRLLAAVVEQLGHPVATLSASAPPDSASLLAINWSFLILLARAALDAVIATGAHSATKNIREGIAERQV